MSRYLAATIAYMSIIKVPLYTFRCLFYSYDIPMRFGV